MAFMAKMKTGGDWELCPEGSFQAVLAEIVDLGMVESEYNGEKKTAHKCLFVYQVIPRDDAGQEIRQANGDRFEVAARFTVSMHEKAALFKWVQAWRGKTFSDEEKQKLISDGFDLELLLNVNALLQVVHNKSTDGTKTYANANAIQPWQKAWGAGVLPDGYIPRAARKKEGEAPVAASGKPVPAPTPAQALSVQAPAQPFKATDDAIPF